MTTIAFTGYVLAHLGRALHEALSRSCSHLRAPLFFQDSDVLMLHSPRFDGIEDPDGDVNRQFGIGDLRPAA